MATIKEILITRDGMTEAEADDLIADAREDLNDLLLQGNVEEAELICETWFGLEPDYIDQLI